MTSFKPLDLTTTGLKPETVKSIQMVISHFPEIQQVVLYGSRAKGTFKNGSDIDLCLIGDELDTGTTLKLDDHLEELMLPYSFDISIYHKIDNPKFKEHIDRVGIIFFNQQPQNKL